MRKIGFIRLCAVSIVSAFAVHGHAQTVDHHRSEELQIGLAGFNFRQFDIDRTIEMMNQIGVKYLSVKDFHLPLNSTREQMEAFKQKLAAAGIEGYTLGPIYMTSEEAVDKTFEYAKRYGAEMFVGVPTYELLPYVEQKVKEYDIRIAIHTHGPDNAPFPDATDAMRHIGDLDPRIGLCLDLGHTVRYGADCVEDLKKYKDRIFDIHIKDVTAPSKAGQTWEMGRGVMDIPAIVKTLRRIGYTGKCTLEFEKAGDNPLPGMAESIGYLRGVCDALK